MYIIIKDEIITIGVATCNGDAPIAKASDNDAKPISAKPCPIKEYLFNTKITPKREAQSETKIPTINALPIKGYEKSFIISEKFTQFHRQIYILKILIYYRQIQFFYPFL